MRDLAQGFDVSRAGTVDHRAPLVDPELFVQGQVHGAAAFGEFAGWGRKTQAPLPGPVPLPATAAAIYDLLTGDQAISAGLGTYLLPGGDTMPAASVLAANEKLPEGVVAGGIELVITRVPGFAPAATYSGVLPNPTWRIYLVAWSDVGDLQGLAQRVLFLLPGSTATTVPGDAPGSGIGVLDQVAITWTNPTVAVEA